jgi:hypothetical protein
MLPSYRVILAEFKLVWGIRFVFSRRIVMTRTCGRFQFYLFSLAFRHYFSLNKVVRNFLIKLLGTRSSWFRHQISAPYENADAFSIAVLHFNSTGLIIRWIYQHNA